MATDNDNRRRESLKAFGRVLLRELDALAKLASEVKDEEIQQYAEDLRDELAPIAKWLARYGVLPAYGDLDEAEDDTEPGNAP